MVMYVYVKLKIYANAYMYTQTYVYTCKQAKNNAYAHGCT